MSEKLKAQVAEFIKGKLNDSGKGVPDNFDNSTPLITSGLLESLYLLELAVFIEEETGTPLDLTSVDFTKEWDTIQGIVNFTLSYD